MGFDFLGQKLAADKGNKLVDCSLLDAVPVVALYFSASWCPPCKEFTPLLAKTYSTINQGSRQLEIVFVSVDPNLAEFSAYFATMPWLAVPFDVDALSDISDKYSISAIPTLLVVGKDGTVKSATGKKDVEALGHAALDLWKKLN